MRILPVLLLLLSFCLYAEDPNVTSYLDTSVIKNFKADSVKRSKPFSLAGYEQCRFDVLVNDTNAAGLSADSACFSWFVETGHQALSSTGRLDTVWSVLDPVQVDTFNSTVAANFAFAKRVTDTLFNSKRPYKTIDSTSISGYMVQSRVVKSDWDQFCRIVFRGGSDNRVGGWVKVVVLRTAQLFYHMRAR
jgi:hypothetical protein